MCSNWLKKCCDIFPVGIVRKTVASITETGKSTRPEACLFVQPIAIHGFTIFVFDTSFYATFEESSCKEHSSL